MAIYSHQSFWWKSTIIVATLCLTSLPASNFTANAQDLVDSVENPEAAAVVVDNPTDDQLQVTEPVTDETEVHYGDYPDVPEAELETPAPVTVPQPQTAVPVSAPGWTEDYYELNAGTATVQVQQNVSTTKGIVRLVGSGWLTDAGTGSTVTIKVNYLKEGSTVQYRRGTNDTGKPGDSTDILNHPGNGNPDATIFWQFQANPDGTFDVEQQLPLGLTTGQSLKFNIASGLVAGDTQRSLNTPSLVVNGVPYVEVDNKKPQCIPSTKPPSATIAAAPSSSGTLLINGKGFCNINGGGAKVAIKIDDGRVERLDTSLHSNQTIWAIVDADPTTGDFHYEMPLPDGTTNGANGSKKPFEQGEHTIRILSGSLQDGDIAASVPPRGSMLSFTVGQYSPPGVPDPVNYSEQLIGSTQRGVTAVRTGRDIEITVPDGAEDDWIFASVYIENGSPRLPWRAQWFQLDAAGKVVLPGNSSIPAGPLRLVVQNGNKGEFGKLLGWTNFKYTDSATPSSVGATPQNRADTYDKVLKEVNSVLLKAISATDEAVKLRKTTANNSETAAPEVQNQTNSEPVERPTQQRSGIVVGRNNSVSSTAATAGVTSGGARPAGAAVGGASYDPKPTTDPKPPVENRDYLSNANSHDVSGMMSGENLNMKIPKLKVGQWAYLYVYSADLKQKPVGAGWVQVDAKGDVHLDTSSLPDGEYTVAAVNDKAELVGWIDINLGGAMQPAAYAGGDNSDTAQQTQLTTHTRLLSTTDWWLIVASVLVPLITAAGLYLFRRAALRKQPLAIANES